MTTKKLKSKITSINTKDSDIKSLSMVITESGEQMVIYERELKVYAKTNSIKEIHAVMSIAEEKPIWELEFELKGGERALLLTSKHKPRQFKNVKYLVELLNEWCPSIEKINLDILVKKK